MTDKEKELQAEAIDYYRRTIADLEKENAELKADNDARKFAMAMSEKVEKQLRQESEKLKETVIKMNNVITGTFSNLTKAKELLTKVMKNTWGIDYLVVKEINEFLKDENIILEDAQVGNSPFDADEVFHKEMKAYPEQFLNSEVEK